jgi:hypothetical protein
LANREYSVTGICARFMIHSPMPAIGWPFHSPAGMQYSPQCMNKPNFASRNQAIFSSCDAGAGNGGGSDVNTGAAAGRAQVALPPPCARFVQQPQVKIAASDKQMSSAVGKFNLFFMRVCNNSIW